MPSVQSELDVKYKLASSTFAISPQLLPASLITFSRCSSWGVHGVFVLPGLVFLGASVVGAEAPGPADGSSVDGPAGEAGAAAPLLCDRRRFFGFVGDEGGAMVVLVDCNGGFAG